MNCFCIDSGILPTELETFICKDCRTVFHQQCVFTYFDKERENQKSWICLRCQTTKFSFQHRTVEVLNTPLVIDPKEQEIMYNLPYKYPYSGFMQKIQEINNDTPNPKNQKESNNKVKGEHKVFGLIRLIVLPSKSFFDPNINYVNLHDLEHLKGNNDNKNSLDSLEILTPEADALSVKIDSEFGSFRVKSFGAFTLWKGTDLETVSNFNWSVKTKRRKDNELDDSLKIYIEDEHQHKKLWVLMVFQVAEHKSVSYDKFLKFVILRYIQKNEKQTNFYIKKQNDSILAKVYSDLESDKNELSLLRKIQLFVNKWGQSFQISSKKKDFRESFMLKFIDCSKIMYFLIYDFLTKFGPFLSEIETNFREILSVTADPQSIDSKKKAKLDAHLHILLDHLITIFKSNLIDFSQDFLSQIKTINFPFWCGHCSDLHPSDLHKLFHSNQTTCPKCRKVIEMHTIKIRPEYKLLSQRLLLFNAKLSVFESIIKKTVHGFNNFQVKVEDVHVDFESESSRQWLKKCLFDKFTPNTKYFRDKNYTEYEYAFCELADFLIQNYLVREKIKRFNFRATMYSLFRILCKLGRIQKTLSKHFTMNFYLNYNIIKLSPKLFTEEGSSAQMSQASSSYKHYNEKYYKANGFRSRGKMIRFQSQGFRPNHYHYNRGGKYPRGNHFNDRGYARDNYARGYYYNGKQSVCIITLLFC